MGGWLHILCVISLSSYALLKIIEGKITKWRCNLGSDLFGVSFDSGYIKIMSSPAAAKWKEKDNGSICPTQFSCKWLASWPSRTWCTCPGRAGPGMRWPRMTTCGRGCFGATLKYRLALAYGQVKYTKLNTATAEMHKVQCWPSPGSALALGRCWWRGACICIPAAVLLIIQCRSTTNVFQVPNHGCRSTRDWCPRSQWWRRMNWRSMPIKCCTSVSRTMAKCLLLVPRTGM